MKSVTLTINTQGPQPHDPVTIFHLGQGFFLAGDRALQSMRVSPWATQCLTPPGVVNLCFAIELFLKSIVVSKGAAPAKTHRLADLFAAIPQADFDAIRLVYCQCVQEPKFEDLIATVNEYFVKVRYDYEFGVFAYHEYPIYVLAEALYKHAAILHGVKSPLETMT